MIAAMEDCNLPVGYHSLSISNQSSPQDVTAESSVDFGRFGQNFILQNYALILPTHLVEYEISPQDQSTESGASMSVVSLRPAALNSMHKEALLRVCDQAAVARAGDNVQFAVDQSYQSLWSEVFALSNSLTNLRDKLDSCTTNIDTFREQADLRGDTIREGLVDYLSHSLKVEQAIALRQFKAKRLLSDTKRLHELYMWMRQNRTREQMLVSWKELCELRDNIAADIDQLMAEPAFHPHTMALTHTNKRLVALRREASLRDRYTTMNLLSITYSCVA